MRKSVKNRSTLWFSCILMLWIYMTFFTKQAYGGFDDYTQYYNRETRCFDVAENNPDYAVYNGSLYTKNFEKLLCYCPPDTTFILHPNVKIIGERAFQVYTPTQEVVVIPWGVTTLEMGALTGLMDKNEPYVRIVLPDTLTSVDASNSLPGRYGNAFYIYSDGNEVAKASLQASGTVKVFIVDSVDYFYGKSDQEPQILSGDLHHTPGGSYCYGLDGQLLKGWHNVHGDLYYFGEDGRTICDIVEIDGLKYYFNDPGVMQTGWIQIGKATHYFDEDGVMQTDWLEIDDKRYHFDENGAMQTGWLETDENLYYLQEDGTVIAPGWQDVNGSRYYFDETGAMARNCWKKIDGKWTRFDEDGGVKKGFWISIAAWFRGLWS